MLVHSVWSSMPTLMCVRVGAVGSLTSYTTSAHSYHFMAFQLGDSSSDQLGGHRKSTDPARIELA